MTTRKPSRSFRPSLSALEARRLLTGPGDPGFIGPVAPPNAPPFDAILNVSIETDAAGDRYIKVDGSDYEDHIRILSYSPTQYSPSVKLELSQYANGVRISTRTTSFHIGVGKKFARFGAVQVDAKGANDAVTNGTEASLIARGGTGQDYLMGGPGYDNLDGGEDADYLSDPVGATLYGGPGNDVLVGSPLADTLYGGPDNDTINGGAGNDALYGEGGDDLLVGDFGDFPNDGKDTLLGGDGRDILLGGGGDDRLDGGLGNDLLEGMSGNDFLDGGHHNDTLRGGWGFDTLSGNLGNDWLYGGQDSDLIDGNDGDDRLYGEHGRDTLRGSNGYDRLWGGDDDDHVDPGYESGPSIDEAEYVDGGPGADRFYKHYSFTGSEIEDLFVDFDQSEGDHLQYIRHW